MYWHKVCGRDAGLAGEFFREPGLLGGDPGRGEVHLEPICLEHEHRRAVLADPTGVLGLLWPGLPAVALGRRTAAQGRAGGGGPTGRAKAQERGQGARTATKKTRGNL